jgi:hypothetical protein
MKLEGFFEAKMFVFHRFRVDHQNQIVFGRFGQKEIGFVSLCQQEVNLAAANGKKIFSFSI